MKLLNELRTVSVAERDGRVIEAVVRVRGIDARAGGRGFVIQSEEPATILVREAGTVRRVGLDLPREFPALAAAVAAPVAANVIARMMRPRRRRRT